jgi:hypothetical protein
MPLSLMILMGRTAEGAEKRNVSCRPHLDTGPPQRRVGYGGPMFEKYEIMAAKRGRWLMGEG